MLDYDIKTPGELLALVKDHLDARTPFSFIRIGDGENFILAQDSIHSPAELISMYNVVAQNTYSGIAIPNLEARDRLLEAIRRASVVGILHEKGNYCWYPMTEKIFRYYKIKPAKTCYAFINNLCVRTPLFFEILRNKRILLVGRPMNRLREVLQRRYGFTGITGVLNLRNYDDLDLAIYQLPLFDYDLALISAGANGKIMATEVMARGKVAFDLGHGADHIITHDQRDEYTWGPAPLRPPAVKQRTDLAIYRNPPYEG